MRLYTIIVSIGAHVAALIVLVAVPLLAMDVVPIAYRVHVFVPAAAAELPDMPPPPRGGNPPVTRDVQCRPRPTQAPDRIEAELRHPQTAGHRTVPIVPGGMPDGVDGAVPILNILPPPVPPPTRREPGSSRRGHSTTDENQTRCADLSSDRPVEPRAGNRDSRGRHQRARRGQSGSRAALGAAAR